MRTERSGLTYFSEDSELANAEDFVARVPNGISSTETLFDALFDVMQLPGYFGFNWNALSDCLCDLSWIHAHRVVLIHDDVPSLPTSELTTYLEVLCECVHDWKEGEDHQLTVVFPEGAAKTIEEGLLRNTPRGRLPPSD